MRVPSASVDAALLADAEQRALQVLAVAHAAGDAVQGDVDHLARHGCPSASSELCMSDFGKHFPRLGWAEEGGQVEPQRQSSRGGEVHVTDVRPASSGRTG